MSHSTVRVDDVSVSGSVANAGDVNGDGIDDQLFGVPSAGAAGAVYVIYGKRSGSSVAVATLGANEGYRIDGVGGEGSLGQAVANAGDINGDGVPDAIISTDHLFASNAEAYVVYGRRNGTTLSVPTSSVDLAALTPQDGYRIDGTRSCSVRPVVGSAGDVNGDGIPDHVIGDCNHTGQGVRGMSGSVFVVYGRRAGTSLPLPVGGAVTLATLSSTDGYRIDGAVAGDGLGIAATNTSDVNGDGIPDLLLGASSSDPGGMDTAGSVYIVYGRRAGSALLPPAGVDNFIDLSVTAPPQGGAIRPFTANDGYMISGPKPSAQLGLSVSDAGDVDGDGVTDQLVGAPGFLADGGSAYLVYGRRAGLRQPPSALASVVTASISQFDGYELRGVQAYSQAGAAVAGVGDVNRDHVPDAAVSVPNVSVGARLGAGEVYVVYGRRTGALTPPPAASNAIVLDPAAGLGAFSGTDGFRIDGASSSAYLGAQVESAGDQNGDGLDDVLSNAPYPATRDAAAYVTTVKPLAANTSAAAEITDKSAVVQGVVDPGGITGSYGVQYGRSADLNGAGIGGQESGYGDRAVSQKVSGLMPATKYYYRVFLTNEIGQTQFGETLSFTTRASAGCQRVGGGQPCLRPALKVKMRGAKRPGQGSLFVSVNGGGAPLGLVRLETTRYAGLPPSRRAASHLRVKIAGSSSLTSGAKTALLKRKRSKGRNTLATFSTARGTTLTLARIRGRYELRISRIPDGIARVDLTLTRIRGAYVPPGRRRCVTVPVTAYVSGRVGGSSDLSTRIKVCARVRHKRTN